ncbi:ABC transporter permease [Paenibacillus sp. SC116]|uniref:ABC transporter permease n=1 Tax=Paenibacillus sp. SC116 TaxID=2968986 RepID=UPI00215B2FA4|nr:ABC transporter permease [Paenibacillus sp. SC116]MCR8843374.1 ABC transporter permease [Paenibacillus sp. SC116]
MRFGDYIRISFDQLRRRKVVTILCALGISIGCAAIVVAMSIGESAAKYSEMQMSRWFKLDEITVSAKSAGQSGDPSAKPEMDEGSLLTSQKLELIRTFPHVLAAAPMEEIGGFQTKLSNGTSSYTQVIATDLNSLQAFGHHMRLGTISDLPQTVIANFGATFGYVDEKARNALYDKLRQNPYDDEVYKQLENLDRLPANLYQQSIQFVQHDQQSGREILSPALRVTGVLKKPDSQTDNMAMNQKVMYVSLETAEWLRKQPGFRPIEPDSSTNMVSATVEHYPLVTVKVDSQENILQVENKIKQLRLNAMNNLEQKERLEKQFAMVRTIALGIGLFVLFIASISIVVAMTMSTHQRRRQIGIMKVLGANLSQIRNMFIVEATLIGLLGGIMGVILSHWIIWGINGLVLASGAEAAEILFIAPWIIPMGMFFAIITGILAGLYPAINASRTDALTAIRRD